MGDPGNNSIPRFHREYLLVVHLLLFHISAVDSSAVSAVKHTASESPSVSENASPTYGPVPVGCPPVPDSTTGSSDPLAPGSHSKRARLVPVIRWTPSTHPSDLQQGGAVLTPLESVEPPNEETRDLNVASASSKKRGSSRRLSLEQVISRLHSFVDKKVFQAKTAKRICLGPSTSPEARPGVLYLQGSKRKETDTSVRVHSSPHPPGAQPEHQPQKEQHGSSKADLSLWSYSPKQCFSTTDPSSGEGSSVQRPSISKITLQYLGKPTSVLHEGRRFRVSNPLVQEKVGASVERSSREQVLEATASGGKSHTRSPSAVRHNRFDSLYHGRRRHFSVLDQSMSTAGKQKSTASHSLTREGRTQETNTKTGGLYVFSTREGLPRDISKRKYPEAGNLEDNFRSPSISAELAAASKRSRREQLLSATTSKEKPYSIISLGHQHRQLERPHQEEHQPSYTGNLSSLTAPGEQPSAASEVLCGVEWSGKVETLASKNYGAATTASRLQGVSSHRKSKRPRTFDPDEKFRSSSVQDGISTSAKIFTRNQHLEATAPRGKTGATFSFGDQNALFPRLHQEAQQHSSTAGLSLLAAPREQTPAVSQLLHVEESPDVSSNVDGKPYSASRLEDLLQDVNNNMTNKTLELVNLADVFVKRMREQRVAALQSRSRKSQHLELSPVSGESHTTIPSENQREQSEGLPQEDQHSSLVGLSMLTTTGEQTPAAYQLSSRVGEGRKAKSVARKIYEAPTLRSLLQGVTNDSNWKSAGTVNPDNQIRNSSVQDGIEVTPKVPRREKHIEATSSEISSTTFPSGDHHGLFPGLHQEAQQHSSTAGLSLLAAPREQTPAVSQLLHVEESPDVSSNVDGKPYSASRLEDLLQDVNTNMTNKTLELVNLADVFVKRMREQRVAALQSRSRKSQHLELSPVNGESHTTIPSENQREQSEGLPQEDQHSSLVGLSMLTTTGEQTPAAYQLSSRVGEGRKAESVARKIYEAPTLRSLLQGVTNDSNWKSAGTVNPDNQIRNSSVQDGIEVTPKVPRREKHLEATSSGISSTTFPSGDHHGLFPGLHQEAQQHSSTAGLSLLAAPREQTPAVSQMLHVEESPDVSSNVDGKPYSASRLEDLLQDVNTNMTNKTLELVNLADVFVKRMREQRVAALQSRSRKSQHLELSPVSGESHTTIPSENQREQSEGLPQEDQHSSLVGSSMLTTTGEQTPAAYQLSSRVGEGRKAESVARKIYEAPTLRSLLQGVTNDSNWKSAGTVNPDNQIRNSSVQDGIEVTPKVPRREKHLEATSSGISSTIFPSGDHHGLFPGLHQEAQQHSSTAGLSLLAAPREQTPAVSQLLHVEESPDVSSNVDGKPYSASRLEDLLQDVNTNMTNKTLELVNLADVFVKRMREQRVAALQSRSRKSQHLELSPVSGESHTTIPSENQREQSEGLPQEDQHSSLVGSSMLTTTGEQTPAAYQLSSRVGEGRKAESVARKKYEAPTQRSLLLGVTNDSNWKSTGTVNPDNQIRNSSVQDGIEVTPKVPRREKHLEATSSEISSTTFPSGDHHGLFPGLHQEAQQHSSTAGLSLLAAPREQTPAVSQLLHVEESPDVSSNVDGKPYSASRLEDLLQDVNTNMTNKTLELVNLADVFVKRMREQRVAALQSRSRKSQHLELSPVSGESHTTIPSENQREQSEGLPQEDQHSSLVGLSMLTTTGEQTPAAYQLSSRVGEGRKAESVARKKYEAPTLRSLLQGVTNDSNWKSAGTVNPDNQIRNSSVQDGIEVTPKVPRREKHLEATSSEISSTTFPSGDHHGLFPGLHQEAQQHSSTAGLSLLAAPREQTPAVSQLLHVEESPDVSSNVDGKPYSASRLEDLLQDVNTNMTKKTHELGNLPERMREERVAALQSRSSQHLELSPVSGKSHTTIPSENQHERSEGLPQGDQHFSPAELSMLTTTREQTLPALQTIFPREYPRVSRTVDAKYDRSSTLEALRRHVLRNKEKKSLETVTHPAKDLRRCSTKVETGASRMISEATTSDVTTSATFPSGDHHGLFPRLHQEAQQHSSTAGPSLLAAPREQTPAVSQLLHVEESPDVSSNVDGKPYSASRLEDLLQDVNTNMTKKTHELGNLPERMREERVAALQSRSSQHLELSPVSGESHTTIPSENQHERSEGLPQEDQHFSPAELSMLTTTREQTLPALQTIFPREYPRVSRTVDAKYDRSSTLEALRRHVLRNKEKKSLETVTHPAKDLRRCSTKVETGASRMISEATTSDVTTSATFPSGDHHGLFPRLHQEAQQHSSTAGPSLLAATREQTPAVSQLLHVEQSSDVSSNEDGTPYSASRREDLFRDVGNTKRKKTIELVNRVDRFLKDLSPEGLTAYLNDSTRDQLLEAPTTSGIPSAPQGISTNDLKASDQENSTSP